MIKVYKIINDQEIVEHVGMTANIEDRFIKHTKRKPSPGEGKFYKRTDVRLEVISEWATRREARKAEVYWQNHYNVLDGGGYNRRNRTREEIEYIRTSPLSTPEIAKELGFNRGYIWKIRNYKIYQEI